MRKLILFILLSSLMTNSVLAKTLVTSVGSYNLKLYNVAIVGNSHASYMSDFIGVDNDLHSISIGNHSVAGDDLNAYGARNDMFTSWNFDRGQTLLARAGDLQGWVNEFINDSPKIEYAVCWFGTNSLRNSIDHFIYTYKNWIKQVRQKSNCKLIIMSIPYSNYSEDEMPYAYDKKTIIRFNLAIIKMLNELDDDNIFFEYINDKVSYSDKIHLSRESYIKIWNEIKNKYDIIVRQVE